MDAPLDVQAHSVAAFVGRALRGPLNTPVLLRSGADFDRYFGGVWNHSTLGPAVQQFFEHGGKRLYVVRVANGARGAMLCLPAAHGVLVLRAVDPGSSERLRVSVDYDGVAADDDEHFNLTVQRVAPKTSLVIDQEIFLALSCSDGSRRFVADVLEDSDLVRARRPTPGGRPIATIGPTIRYDNPYIDAAQRGTDGQELTDYDLVGAAGERSGIFSLDAVEAFDFLYLPPAGRDRDVGPAALLAAELYCRKRGAILLTDPPADAANAFDAIQAIRQSGIASPNMLAYFPRMRLRDAPAARPRAIGGAIAGLLCRMDDAHGPWLKPDDEGYSFRRRYAPAVELDERDLTALLREGINPVAPTGAGRSTLRGSVTLARSAQMERRFVSLPLRRLCLHITNTVERATRWAVFEAGGPQVAEQVRAQVHAFLVGLYDQGAFASDRFDVQCDSGLHLNPMDPERGVTILVSFQPRDATGDIWLTLHQTVRGCRVSSTAFAPVTAVA